MPVKDGADWVKKRIPATFSEVRMVCLTVGVLVDATYESMDPAHTRASASPC